MRKKIFKKEMQKLEKQMRISHVVHDRPPVGRTAVLFRKMQQSISGRKRFASSADAWMEIKSKRCRKAMSSRQRNHTEPVERRG